MIKSIVPSQIQRLTDATVVVRPKGDHVELVIYHGGGAMVIPLSEEAWNTARNTPLHPMPPDGPADPSDALRKVIRDRQGEGE